MILTVFVLVWFGGNAVAALVALIFGWLNRRAAYRALAANPVWLYQPGLQQEYTDRIIAEAFFAVPEFMAMVREEERGTEHDHQS